MTAPKETAMLITDRTELMAKLAEHAKTLGWNVAEWNWVDESDGYDEYQLWLTPLPVCGEVGTSWPDGGDEPKFTAPCALAPDHEEPHDWAQREAAAKETSR